MNPIDNLINGFRDLAAHVPELVQPLIVALAGAVPFIEGEISAMIGVWAGLHPVVAGLAGAIGNFACVVVVVLAGSRIRAALIARRQRRASAVDQPAPVAVGATATGSTPVSTPGDAQASEAAEPTESKGAQRFRRFLVRFGVPGASILGPLALPTQFTSAILVASGVSKGWVLLWQAVAIVLWTSLTTVSAWGALVLLGA